MGRKTRLERTAPALGAALVGVAIGAVSLYLTLVSMAVGLLILPIALVLAGRRVGPYQASLVGGCLVGAGLAGALAFLPALTNTDRAVTYAPSTVPAFYVCVAIGGAGLVLLAAVGAAGLRKSGGSPHG